MQHTKKSIDEMRAEIQKLEGAKNLPGIPADEVKIYQSAIDKITALIRDMESSAPQAVATNADRPVLMARPQIEIPPKPAESPSPNPTHQRDQRKPVKAAQSTVWRNPNGQDAKHTINAVVTPGAKKVRIHWGNGQDEVLTEGETRSRFTTALRDLAQSRMVRQERFEQLPEYVTFQRARTYYRALAYFWGAPPSAQQLCIAPLGKAKAVIFEMISNSH